MSLLDSYIDTARTPRKYTHAEFTETFLRTRALHPHWTHKLIAEDMGLSYPALDKALQRARKAGYDIPPTRGSLDPHYGGQLIRQQMGLRKRIALDLEDVTVPRGWNASAACKDVGDDEADRFVPDERTKVESKNVQSTKTMYCSTCPVQPECLATGLKDPIHVGIWGGKLITREAESVDLEKLKQVLSER